jgi:hypothetical protein
MKRYINFVILLFVLINFAGCYLSSRVSTIGVRRDEVSARTVNTNFTIDYCRYVQTYANGPASKSTAFTTVDYLYAYGQMEAVSGSFRDLNLGKDDNGYFVILVNEKEYLREYLLDPQSGQKTWTWKSSFYRKWWGYPSQILLVVTMPIDVLIFPITVLRPGLR